MARVRRINVSQIEGDNSNNTSTSEIRPYGDMALYQGDNGKLELLIADGIRTNVKNKVLNKGTFYGGDADSGDGLNYDTIKLVPDEVLRRNGSDQYIIIDPTGGEPNHIHLRAGGTIDSSSTDIFLGGEKNNVRVSDVNDRVTITTDFGVDGQTRTWTFNNNGGLQLPGSSNGLIGESEPGLVIFSDSNFAVQTNANTDSTKSWIFGSDGNLSLPPGFIRSTQVTGLNLASNYDVHILADYTDNNHEWIFEASTAELTVPGAIKSKTNPPTGTQVVNLPYILGAGLNNGYVGVSPEWNAIVALGDLTGYTLTAQQTGSTIFTTTITQMRDDLGGQPAFQTANPLPGYAADITFTLTSPDYAPQTFDNLELAAGNNTWTFSSTTGGLTFPDGSTQFTAGGLDQLEVDGRTILTAPDQTIVIQPSYRPTITRQAGFGSGSESFVIDITEDDDITAVTVQWECNTGSEETPVWSPVAMTGGDPGVTYIINVPGFTFVQGTAYTFRQIAEETKPWTFRPIGTLITPAGVILSSEYQAGTPNYRDFSIEMLEPGDTFEHRWVFRNDATLSIPGDLEFEDGTRQSTAVKQGEYVFEFDGVNTDVTLTEVNFNLLYAKTAIGYSGSDTHNINLPAGTPGQRLVIVNVSNFCTLTINNSKQITVTSGPAEIIYSANDDWITLYGTV